MSSLTIPPSNSTVRVRAIDAKTLMSVHSRRFIEPDIDGFATLNFTSICFLIDHLNTGQRILFDCGARKDLENYSPATKARLNMIMKGIHVEVDVNEVLVDAGIGLESINSIVWSHWHWDHLGAAAKFPKSVEVVVGPGFKENFMPGYPTNPEAPLLDADFDGRTIRELSFQESGLKIGQFAALDFFGDGSFYLLDSPGHAIGHMCGLARTTPTTAIFMGGDICHFAGMHRPTMDLPLPDPIPSDQLDDWFPMPCPCSVFTDRHPRAGSNTNDAKTTPFFEITSVTPCSYLDKKTAMVSIQKMMEFDASPDVLVCIAHDPSSTKVLPFLNDQPEEDLNNWKARGYKEKALWGWLNDLPRNGKPGRPILVDGTWKDGKQITDFTALSSSP